MTSKKRRPRKGTYPFFVTGPVPNFKHIIREWTSAVHERQALKADAKKAGEKVPPTGLAVYLGDCTVTRGRKNKENDTS